MGRYEAKNHRRTRDQTISIRIDADAKADLARLAYNHGVTVSTLVMADIRHLLREGRPSFPLPGEEIPVSEIEKRARWRRLRDEDDFTDWSKLDVYDG